MSYAVKYRLEAFSAKYNDVYRVDIFEDGYTGPILLKNMGAGKIVLSKSEGIIQKTTLEISIQSDDNFEFVGFMQYDNRKYLVQLRKNGDIIWQGYHVAESYSEPYQNPPYDVSIIATDNLGLLENYTFNNEELPGRLATAARLSHFEAIDACINNTNLALYYDIAVDFYEQTMDTNESMLHQLYFKADILNGQNCKEVVEALLPYGAILTQHNNRWLIRRPLDDAEKTHIIYTIQGERFGTKSGETLLTLSDYVTGGVWPHGTPILELEHAWKDALLIKEYGKKQSFLQNYNFADGAEKWTGSYSVKKVDNVYYAQIQGYAAPGSNVSVYQGINVISTASDFIFECQFDILGGRNSSATSVILADKSIEVTAKIQVQIGSYYLTSEGWSTTAQAIELLISSSPSRKPNWKTLRVVADGVPTSGELTVRFFKVESESLSNKWISGICFTDVKVYTEELNTAPSPQTYKVDILENAAGGRNEIKLKPTDLPIVSNAELFYQNGSTIGDYYYAAMWSHNGGTAKVIQSAIADQLANYYQMPRHRISGCNWRGVGMSLNAVAQHPKNANKKFTVQSGSWNILDDTFNVVWIETAGNGSATAVEYSGDVPASEAAGTGSSNLNASHPPVTIHEDSTDYLEIADDQVLKFTPEDYHWFINSPQQIVGYMDPPSDPFADVNGTGTVTENFPAGFYQITAFNENGETSPVDVPAFDVLTDTSMVNVSWLGVIGATHYRVYINDPGLSGTMYKDVTGTSFDHLTITFSEYGYAPIANTAAIYSSARRVNRADVVNFVGENIEIETTATGTTKTVTFTGHPPVTISTGSFSYLSISADQELSLQITGFDAAQSDWNQTDTNALDYIKNKPEIPSVNSNYLKDWIEFEFRDVEAGTTGEYVLDIKALINYNIDSAVFQVDDGSLTDVSVKINGSDVTGLSSISATTTTTETAATGTVSAGNLVTMSIGDTYTGSPTLIRGKLNLTRT